MSCDAPLSISTDARARYLRAAQVFAALALPGMTLLSPRAMAERIEPMSPKPRPQQSPSSGHCPGCGRPISRNKTRCRPCQDAKIIEIAGKITSQEMLDQVLDGLEADERAELLPKMQPHLKFTELTEKERQTNG
jgi:hypothetical protein